MHSSYDTRRKVSNYTKRAAALTWSRSLPKCLVCALVQICSEPHSVVIFWNWKSNTPTTPTERRKKKHTHTQTATRTKTHVYSVFVYFCASSAFESAFDMNAALCFILTHTSASIPCTSVQGGELHLASGWQEGERGRRKSVLLNK